METSDYRLITGKYPTACNICNGKIAVGERVWYDIRKIVKGVAHAQCRTEGKALVAEMQASRATDAEINIPAPEGISYLPYQRAGIAFALRRQNTLITDEMGLGKTVQAIGVLNSDANVRKVLVVCPKSLLLNWRNELTRWDVHGRSVAIFPQRAEITLINYDQLGKLDAQAWDMLILDEAHYIKNEDAKRTQYAIAHVKLAKKVLALTGTPLDKPKEIWTLVSSLDPKTWNTQDKWAKLNFLKRYCGAYKERIRVRGGWKDVWNFEGASNLEELQEKLRSTIMVRRLKTDVLKDLPPKRRQIVVLGEQPDSGYADGLTLENYDDQVAALKKSADIEFSEVSKIRHEEALRKLPLAVDYIREVLETTDKSYKVVVFAHHKDVVRELEMQLTGHGVLTIVGETPSAERMANVEAFQTGSARVMLGSIGAMGTGLTLTASAHVIFVELDWSPKNTNQAEDRCHRIGQTESLLVQHLVLDGSIDSKIAKILVRKQEVANRALDTESVYGAPTLDEIAFTSCTCLAAPGSENHATWCDFYKPEAVKPRIETESKPERKITDAEVTRIHEALRILAGMCDGARERDGAGFNKLDADFGRSLAMCPRLSDKQALRARLMLKKYKRQIGEV